MKIIISVFFDTKGDFEPWSIMQCSFVKKRFNYNCFKCFLLCGASFIGGEFGLILMQLVCSHRNWWVSRADEWVIPLWGVPVSLLISVIDLTCVSVRQSHWCPLGFISNSLPVFALCKWTCCTWRESIERVAISGRWGCLRSLYLVCVVVCASLWRMWVCAIMCYMLERLMNLFSFF